MNAPRPSHPLDGELGDLWHARDSLDQAEWTRLYRIVMEILLPYRPQELSGLGEQRDVYVQDFFSDVVMRPAAVPSRVHAGALKHYYVNYLRDQLDRQKTQQKYFGASLDEPDEDECRSCADPVAGTDGDTGFQSLAEMGVTIGRLRESARDFLGGAEPWVPVYLALSFCPDPERREPLAKLAARMGISSHHHKAKKLGINWGADKTGNAGQSFESTMIGRWVSGDLGIAITAENHDALDATFKILCLEALLWAESQEANQ